MTDHPHPQPPFELASQQIGPLPIVDTFLRRAGVERVLARHATCRPGIRAPRCRRRR